MKTLLLALLFITSTNAMSMLGPVKPEYNEETARFIDKFTEYRLSFFSVDKFKNKMMKTYGYTQKDFKRFKKYAPLIIDIANELELDPRIALAVAWTESNFKPEAVSWANAEGLMQVKPDTRDYAFTKDARYKSIITKRLNQGYDYQVLENVVAGVIYINYLLAKFDDQQQAIVAYNMGPRNVYRLLRRNYNLDRHNYYQKVFNRLVLLVSYNG